MTGVAVPYLADDVNTDEITPVHRELEPDYAELFFARRRRLGDGSLDPDFPFNKPQFARPSVLVAGRNFGCGSSREGAVWAMLAVGIRAIVARSFSDIYRDNCLKNGVCPVVLAEPDAQSFEEDVISANGGSPVTIDLRRQIVAGPSGREFSFEISPAERTALLEGLDDIGMSLREQESIAAFEARERTAFPWLQTVEQNEAREP